MQACLPLFLSASPPLCLSASLRQYFFPWPKLQMLVVVFMSPRQPCLHSLVLLLQVKWTPGVWHGSQSDIEWSSFISTILWNLQGFDNLGCIAGEVKNVKVSYPLGVSVATAAISTFYVLPVLGSLVFAGSAIPSSCVCRCCTIMPRSAHYDLPGYTGMCG
jgi:hypothetical protein